MIRHAENESVLLDALAFFRAQAKFQTTELGAAEVASWIAQTELELALRSAFASKVSRVPVIRTGPWWTTYLYKLGLSGYGGLKIPPGMRRIPPCYWETHYGSILRKVAEEPDGSTEWREHLLSFVIPQAIEANVGLPGTTEELLGMSNAAFIEAIGPVLCELPQPSLPGTDLPGQGIPPSGWETYLAPVFRVILDEEHLGSEVGTKESLSAALDYWANEFGSPGELIDPGLPIQDFFAKARNAVSKFPEPDLEVIRSWRKKWSWGDFFLLEEIVPRYAVIEPLPEEPQKPLFPEEMFAPPLPPSPPEIPPNVILPGYEVVRPSRPAEPFPFRLRRYPTVPGGAYGGILIPVPVSPRPLPPLPPRAPDVTESPTGRTAVPVVPTPDRTLKGTGLG